MPTRSRKDRKHISVFKGNEGEDHEPLLQQENELKWEKGQVQVRGYVRTGQVKCYDSRGHEIPCRGTGQDGELRRGLEWPEPRFEENEETVLDRLTGLVWTQNANFAEFPLMWQESLNYVSSLNREHAFGYADWRLPNRRELRSLISLQTKKPALPKEHPFKNVFDGWYWTSTTAAINTAYAWYVHMEGARMFYGGKEQSFFLWPVRGEGNGIFPTTGQSACYDSNGTLIPCAGTGQDGEFRTGRLWPSPRFKAAGHVVIDQLTDLCWLKVADLTGGLATWDEAFEAIGDLNHRSKGTQWRLPNINELETLVDCSAHSPALPTGHPFEGTQEAYWSSTTSMFEPDWAWALYLLKGAVGVGRKSGAHFSVWAVTDMCK